MTMQIPMPTKQEDRPSCFGREWDPNVAECAGGADPKYTNPRTGSHIREQCTFFNECGARVQQARLIAPNQLTKQPVQLPSGRPMAPFEQYMFRKQQAEVAQNQAQIAAAAAAAQQQQQARPVFPWPVPQQAPMQYPYPAPGMQQQYPAPMYQLNYMMPPYLTVPEQRMHGQSIWGLLARESVRAMGKSLGHTISNFFDQNPFRVQPPPGGDQNK